MAIDRGQGIAISTELATSFDVQGLIDDATAAKVAAQVAKAAAEVAETNAETAETNAEASEAGGAASALSANASATSASTSATNASNAQTAAETAETNAETAQTAAELAETHAETAETNAETAEANAQSSENDAETAQTASETAKTQAETAKTAAQSAKTSAETAETNALASKNAASASQSSATASATSATASAASAGSSATDAQSSEDDADTSAIASAASASASSASASSASTSASTATTQAGIATTKAGVATTKASEASTSATASATSATNAAASEAATANKLPLAGGALTGAVTTTSTFDGRDVAADGVTADAALPKSGGTVSGDVGFIDGAKATFGDSNDLQIYHDGTHSRIVDTGTGSMVLSANEFYVYDAGGVEPKIGAKTNGSVDLYYDAVKKLATTSTGINVTGSVTASGRVKAHEAMEINGDTGYGRIEIGGDSGAYVDLKNPNSDDYDVRFITHGTGGEIEVAGSNDLIVKTNSATRLRVKDAGIDVTGTVAATAYTGDGSALTGIDALPTQTGHTGKYLGTNGSTATWNTLDTDANSTTKGLYEHANTISANYSITSGNNAMTAGPITINTGVSVTIPTGSTWVIA